MRSADTPLTSWPSLRTDIVNAGGSWVDKKEVSDQGLVTSRKEGRVRTCVIEKKAFAAADAWLSEQRALWEARFDRFDALLEDTRDD